jgi:hypothetical protein
MAARLHARLSTGGTPSGTLAAVGNTSTTDQSAAINNALASLASKTNAILSALGTAGLMA